MNLAGGWYVYRLGDANIVLFSEKAKMFFDFICACIANYLARFCGVTLVCWEKKSNFVSCVESAFIARIFLLVSIQAIINLKKR
jgi:hypothetical protein